VFFINGAGIGQHISQLQRFLNDYCFGSIKYIRRLDEERFDGFLSQIRHYAVSGTASNRGIWKKAQLHPLAHAEGDSWAVLFLVVLRFRLIHPFQKA
jgi:hypothetical protein